MQNTGPIKKIGIIYRSNSKKASQLSRKLNRWLKTKKINVLDLPQTIKSNGKQKPKKLPTVDLIIVLGGDGTYLGAVRLLETRKTPILGINLGTLGFLTEISVDDVKAIVQMALDHKLEMHPRTMLNVKIKQKNKKTLEYNALNDVVVERGARSYLINLSIYCEKHLVSDLKADGVIVSSPTGSTAYNLAAGGPILHPSVNAFVVTPICAHSLTNRPTIFPDDLKLSFKVNNPNQKAYITVDGQIRAQIGVGDEIVIKKAPCVHYVLRKPGHNYFNLLREKLRFGERN